MCASYKTTSKRIFPKLFIHNLRFFYNQPAEFINDLVNENTTLLLFCFLDKTKKLLFFGRFSRNNLSSLHLALESSIIGKVIVQS